MRLQHVLSKGIQGVRDYGFLCDNAKTTTVSAMSSSFIFNYRVVMQNTFFKEYVAILAERLFYVLSIEKNDIVLSQKA